MISLESTWFALFLFRWSSKIVQYVDTVAFVIVVSKLASKSNLWQYKRADAHTNTQTALHGQPLFLGVLTDSRCNTVQTAGVMNWAPLFCWQFAAKLACWLHFCCIVFTGAHAEREIELRLSGSLRCYHSSAFGRLAVMLWKRVRESWGIVWGGWVGVTLFCDYQADCFERVALDLRADFRENNTNF